MSIHTPIAELARASAIDRCINDMLAPTGAFALPLAPPPPDYAAFIAALLRFDALAAKADALRPWDDLATYADENHPWFAAHEAAADALLELRRIARNAGLNIDRLGKWL